VWDAFLQGIFEVIKWFYGFAHDWGLAIILITILFRIIIYPITRKQFQSSHKMQKMQPLINEIRAKYAGDPTRMNEEMMKVYQEAKFNPLAGCLPMLLQMPIAIALFWVLRDLLGYIERSNLDQTTALPATFYGVIRDLTVGPSTVLAEHGIGPAIPYIILLLLFSVSMLVPILINKTKDRNQLIMFGVMAALMLWFGWTMPAGVLLYWDATSLIGVGQQFVSKKMLDAKDAAQEAQVVEVKPVKVEVERKTKKNRPKKSK
jgi:YidC/Oxa1 family membrane protein insertase